MNSKKINEILIVDDEPADANLIRDLFSSEYSIVLAKSADNAINHVKRCYEADENPALIVLDLHLPGMSGFQVFERIKSMVNFEETAVVILTNSDSDTDRQRASELGADRFITKPMDVREFEETIVTLEEQFLESG